MSIGKDVLARKIIKLYSGSGWKSLFAKIRFWDAPYKKIEKIVPREGIIIDLGCGEGFFSNYLALCSGKRKVIGIELNKTRITLADKGLPNTKFILGDVNRVKIPKAKAIVLMHVLHHLDSYNGQEKLLRVCKSKLCKNGELIIIEIEPKFSLKFFLTYIVDHFIVPWLFEKKLYSKIFFRKKKVWVALLNRLEFKVHSHSADKFMPFTHVIFECKKK